jgi:DNA-binding MarR family transcriptional regulator
MAAGGFDELELLSQEALIFEALRKLLKASKELSRREEVTRDFLRSLCDFSLETRVWFILWESGGAQRFTEILRVAGCSRSRLSVVLRVLLKSGLVRMVEKRYQAVSPAWLVLK